LQQHSGVWSEYYEEANQREDYITQKKQIINDWISRQELKTAIDVGANEGAFSQLLAEKNIYTISADFDHYSINKLYNELKRTGNRNIHPLVMDVSNPSPAIGVNNEERTSFLQRTETDMVMALALIHHLCIGKNIPFEDIVKTFRKLGKALIIEFVPKEDEKVRQMLQQKKDIYDWYTEEAFLSAFSGAYKIIDSKEIGTSKRVLYLMQPL
jgi:ribosomal protein L11 methylase PrmA